MDHSQMDLKTRNIAIYKKLLQLFDDYILSSKLRILATARTPLGTEFPESLHITLNSGESVSATEMHELLQSNPKNFDMIKEALNWAVHATRPLTLSELSVAIALSRVQKESGTSGPDSQTDNYMMELLEEYMSFDLQKDLQFIIGKAIKVAGSKGNVHIMQDSFRKCFESFEGQYIPRFHELITQRCLSYMCGVLKHGGEIK
ncbi:hypothetical protein J3458_021480 [Metarhizium acridum]|uniref:uncharacterized protein n=1 Tax=Metarhizium acridum TaxID=92637 RepID=UPI001C6B38E2|nr:hypothetical protein J3458_021480 [Metarhizium acridum]